MDYNGVGSVSNNSSSSRGVLGCSLPIKTSEAESKTRSDGTTLMEFQDTVNSVLNMRAISMLTRYCYCSYVARPVILNSK